MKGITLIISLIAAIGMMGLAQADSHKNKEKRHYKKKMHMKYKGKGCYIKTKDADVSIENIDNGVRLTYTSSNPEDVKLMQKRAEHCKSGKELRKMEKERWEKKKSERSDADTE